MDDPGGDRELARKLSSPGGPKPGRKPSSGPARQNLIATKSLPKIDHLYSGKLLFTGPGPGCVWSGYPLRLAGIISRALSARRPCGSDNFDRGIVRIEILCCTFPALDVSRREGIMGLVADPAAGVESARMADYDHGIMTMIVELWNEKNGCRFF